MAKLSPRVARLVQAHLSSIEPYDPHFSPVRVNLSANENTHAWPDALRARVDAALAGAATNRYPDPMSDALRDGISAWHGIPRDRICVGNGGDELLYNFLLAFGGCGRTLLNCPPTFSEYAFFASLTETRVLDAPRDPETFAPDIDEVVRLAAECDLVIITSPNNPTGGLVDAESVRAVCAACPGLVMVDEAYVEFADDAFGAKASALPLLAGLDNLAVLRTLSKAFGLAGARCGYVAAAPDVIEAFSAVRQIYSVNVLTQAAAACVVRGRDEIAAAVADIRAERERMRRALSGLAEDGLPVRVWPSEANFLLVRVPDAHAVHAALRDEFSILVRDFSSVAGLADCLRITIGTAEENDQAIAALSALLKRREP